MPKKGNNKTNQYQTTKPLFDHSSFKKHTMITFRKERNFLLCESSFETPLWDEIELCEIHRTDIWHVIVFQLSYLRIL